MYAKLAAQLKIHGRNEAPEFFFDYVIFCANVTYADGGFKGGEYLPLKYSAKLVADSAP